MKQSLSDFQSIEYKQSAEFKKIVESYKNGPKFSAEKPFEHEFLQGICFGLCCEWIASHRRYRTDGQVKRMEAMQRRIDDIQADKQQFYKALNTQINSYGIDTFEKGGKETKPDMLKRMNMGGERHGVKFVNKWHTTHCKPPGYEILTLRGQVCRTHAYTLTALSFKEANAQKTSGHAICAYQSGGKIFGFGSHLYAFDPNVGEFRISNDDVPAFYIALFKMYASKGLEVIAHKTYAVTNH